MRNYCKFEIKGLNQESFFNELSKSFKIYDIERIAKDHSFFKVKIFHFQKVEKELINHGFEILSIKKAGILLKLFKIITSYGLIVGIVFGFTLFFVQSLFIRKIEVWGNENLQVSQIESVVKKNIGSGFKGKINTEKLENSIYSSFSNLSFVSVSIVGQTVVVNIKEEIIPEEMKGNFLPLVSQFDAIITDIKLIQGTLCVSVGDIIQAGQTLVLPYIINSNGEEMPVKAVANITADVWLTGQETHNSYVKETYKTGEKTTKNEIYIGKLKIYEKYTDNKFKSFEVVEESKILTKNNLFPFTLKETTYYETATRVIESNFLDVKDEIISKARANALQKISSYDIIKSERKTIKQVGNLTTVNYIITVSRNIGG